MFAQYQVSDLQDYKSHSLDYIVNDIKGLGYPKILLRGVYDSGHTYVKSAYRLIQMHWYISTHGTVQTRNKMSLNGRTECHQFVDKTRNQIIISLKSEDNVGFSTNWPILLEV